MASSPTGASDPDHEKQQKDFYRFLHVASLSTLVIAPIIIALPPRKLDLYTFSLGGAFVISANYQTKQRTGQGLVWHLHRPLGLSQQTRDFQAAQLRAREQKRLLEEASTLATPAEKKRGLGIQEKAKEIWMGGETEGWQERRMREEQEKLAQGASYSSLIIDQIWDVWNWGDRSKKSDKEDAEVPESKTKG